MKIRNLAVAALATLAGLVLAELLVRALHLAPDVTRIEIDRPYGTFVASEDPILKYVPKPGSGDINAYGIRDHTYPIAKPPRTYRILIIGDSIGFGFCNDQELLPVDSVFAKVLERRLGTHVFPGYDKVEVLNLCVSGYNTPQEVAFLEHKGLGLAPDLVIVEYCLNDSWISSAELNTFKKSAKWHEYAWMSALPRGLFFRSHLVRLVWYRGEVLREKLGGHASSPSAESSGTPSPGRDPTTQGFVRLRQLGAERGFKVLIVIFPWFEDYRTYTKGVVHRFVSARAEQSGFEHLDLLLAFASRSGGDYKMLQGDCSREHPNALGHRVAATAIESFLLQRILRATR